MPSSVNAFPLLYLLSASLACFNASSSVTVMKLFMEGSLDFILFKYSWVSSTELKDDSYKPSSCCFSVSS